MDNAVVDPIPTISGIAVIAIKLKGCLQNAQHTKRHYDGKEDGNLTPSNVMYTLAEGDIHDRYDGQRGPNEGTPAVSQHLALQIAVHLFEGELDKGTVFAAPRVEYCGRETTACALGSVGKTRWGP